MEAYPPLPFRVKCIDEGNGTLLTVAKIYSVIEVKMSVVKSTHDLFLIFINGREYQFGSNRFTIFDAIPQTPAIATPIPTVDTADWRIWRDHGLPPDHCVCRILRSQCSFHR